MTTHDHDIDQLVDRYRLEPHPEGGWFRRTWTSDQTGPDGRRAASSILYLLGPRSEGRWHRIDADELWVHAGGGGLALRQWSDGAAAVRTGDVGPGVDSLVPAGTWQQAVTGDSWSLVNCVVVPEFVEQGFELAPEGWTPLPG